MKILTDSQINGELGEKLVESAFLKIGFVYEGRGRLEAGIDGLVELRDPLTGQALGRILAVQVKTTAKGRYTAESDAEFEYLLDPEDLAYWRGVSLPVIIVLCRLSDSTLYWKSVMSGDRGEPRRLRVSKETDVLDASAADALASLTIDRSAPGTWLPPLGGGESATVNLVRVLPPRILFTADIRVGSGGEAARAIADAPERRFDWVVRGNRLLAFFDPREACTAHLLDGTAVTEHNSQAFGLSDSEDDRNDFAHLLRRALEHQVRKTLRYYPRDRVFAFRAEKRHQDRVYAYQASTNRTSATVVKAYKNKKDPSTVAYVRHHAFSARFEAIAEDWFIVVEPTFVFTEDGFALSRLAEPLLAGKKRLETNAAVRGQVLMWQELLVASGTDERDLLSDPDEEAQYRLGFEPVPVLDVPRAVPEADWSRVRSEALGAPTDGLFG